MQTDPDDDRLVALATVPDARYADSTIRDALAQSCSSLGWAAGDAGPFGAVVPKKARVLVKPNWVLHANQGPWGVQPLVTHPAIIRAVVDGVLASDAARVVVGDAPVQGCDFERLLDAGDLRSWASELQACEPRFAGVRDFRRTKSIVRDGYRRTSRDQQGMEDFVLFDLAGESLLEPITVDGAFRVTMYDPAMMRRTHAPGRHQFLVAREILEADVVINLPKLKTHKKAGITCALKNLIGINGNKEFLPHHRVGGAGEGGDCYPGRSRIKRSLEFAFDLQNSTDLAIAQRALSVATRALDRAARMAGDQLGVEGSWSGNDTIWRTCLDLNRILLYGRPDGTVADTVQRRVLNVVDAVVAGQGDGPLAPQPLPLGLIVAGGSSAAVDWVGAILLGYVPERIPITAHAFDRFRWPLADFGPQDIRIAGALGTGAAGILTGAPLAARPEAYPLGWLDAVLSPAGLSAVTPTAGDEPA
jgi:uncharacterized protein (DUF362 family)